MRVWQVLDGVCECRCCCDCRLGFQVLAGVAKVLGMSCLLLGQFRQQKAFNEPKESGELDLSRPTLLIVEEICAVCASPTGARNARKSVVGGTGTGPKASTDEREGQDRL